MKTYLKTKLGSIYAIVGEWDDGYLCNFFEEGLYINEPFFIHHNHIAVVDTNFSIVSNFKVEQNEI